VFPELLLLNEKKAWSSSLLIASRIILKQLADIDALTDAIIAVQKQGSGGIVKGSTGDLKIRYCGCSLKVTLLLRTRYYLVPIQAQEVAAGSSLPIQR